MRTWWDHMQWLEGQPFGSAIWSKARPILEGEQPAILTGRRLHRCRDSRPAPLVGRSPCDGTHVSVVPRLVRLWCLGSLRAVATITKLNRR